MFSALPIPTLAKNARKGWRAPRKPRMSEYDFTLRNVSEAVKRLVHIASYLLQDFG